MTLDGTNTWLLSEPDSDLAVVIDPGPLDDAHLRNVIATAEGAGKRIALTLLTHGHPDHAEGAARFAELTRTPVRALDPALRLGEEGLAAGDVITTGGLELRVVDTPGHTSDSLCFQLTADSAVLTGDTVLGRGTTMVAHPDGRLGDYLDSLRRLQALTADGGVSTVLPGHGPVLADARGAVEFYLAHRASRLAQVETAVEKGLHDRRAGRRTCLRGRESGAVAGGGAVRAGATGLPARARPDLRQGWRGRGDVLKIRCLVVVCDNEFGSSPRSAPGPRAHRRAVSGCASPAAPRPAG